GGLGHSALCWPGGRSCCRCAAQSQAAGGHDGGSVFGGGGGGSGGADTSGGGGGGGGYFGGGGGGAGCNGGSGGGGASGFNPGTSNQSRLLDTTGVPSITLTYTGGRAAALAGCKKRARKPHLSHKRLQQCKKKARLLPA